MGEFICVLACVFLVCLFVCLRICLFDVCFFDCMLVCLFVRVSVCLCVCLFVCLFRLNIELICYSVSYDNILQILCEPRYPSSPHCVVSSKRSPNHHWYISSHFNPVIICVIMLYAIKVCRTE